MTKSSAYVIISGNLIEKESVLAWLKELTANCYTVVCIGGGEQINRAFKEKGWENNFGPMGRICETLEQRQVCETVLRETRDIVQDLFADRLIVAQVVIPLGYDGDVLSPINNDHMVSRVYNGYDRIYRLTTKEKVETKLVFFNNLAEVCQVIGKGKMNKLEVLGF